MDLLAEVRDRWQFYRDRRPDAYGDLVRAVSDAASRAARSSRRPGPSTTDVLVDGETIAALYAPGLEPASRRTGPSTPPAST